VSIFFGPDEQNYVRGKRDYCQIVFGLMKQAAIGLIVFVLAEYSMAREDYVNCLMCIDDLKGVKNVSVMWMYTV
jgi:hypothetical protein